MMGPDVPKPDGWGTGKGRWRGQPPSIVTGKDLVSFKDLAKNVSQVT